MITTPHVNSTYGLVLLMLAAGFVAGRTRVFPDNAADTLTRFVIFVCLPARILELVPRLHFGSGLLLLALVPWLLLPLAYGIVIGAARLRRWPRSVQAALLLCVPLGNTSFLGFPVIEALLGREAVGLAVVYDQFGSFLILTTYGLLVLAANGGGKRPKATEIGARVLRFPPFIALMLALVPVAHPAWLTAVVSPLAATLVPVAMFAVGLKMELRIPKHPDAFVFGLLVKMIVLPALAFGFAALARANPAVTRVAVLESAMPPMITASAMAMMAGLAPELAAALAGYGILVSMATLPWIASMLP